MHSPIQLDDQQSAAVQSTEKNILVAATAGSGKTRVSIQRILRLIDDGVQPGEIVAITYTNQAADLMKARLGDVQIGVCSTLHAFILSLIQSHYHVLGLRGRVTVIDEEDAIELLDQAKAGQRYTGAVGAVRDALAMGIVELPPTPSKAQLVAKAYYDSLVRNCTIDVDSILVFGEELLSRFPEVGIRTGDCMAQYLFVDEGQDCSERDFRILDKLPIPNRFICGDPDQSLYGFRGAFVQGFVGLSKRPGWQTILLENNYRSCREITGPAQKLIANNPDRIDKRTISQREDLGRFAVRRFESAGLENAWVADFIQNCRRNTPAVPDTEIAVLVRSNHLVLHFSEYLQASGIPVRKRVRRDVPDDWHKARLVLGLLANPDNDYLAHQFMTERDGKDVADKVELEAADNFVSINRHALNIDLEQPGILNVMMVNGGVSVATNQLVHSRALAMEQFESGPVDYNRLAMVLAEEIFTEEQGEGVTVCTMHASKGQEFSCVILPAFEDEVMPGRHKNEDIPEARRVAFVAMTRAKDCLVITHAAERKRQWTGDRLWPATPSRFIAECS